MSNMEKIEAILKKLLLATPPTKDNNTIKPPNPLNVCSSIKAGEVPQYNISFNCTNVLLEFDNTELTLNSLSNQCSNLQNSQITLNLCLNFLFNQNWLLKNIAISDLSSSITLAPSEKLTLEFQNTQRKLLEQSILDSTEQLQSDESTSIDKDMVNVVRESSKTKNWSVSANSEVNIPIKFVTLSFGSSGGINQELTEKNKNASQSIREATRKSAESLKSLHKIEVKGTSEYIVTNRMTRVIENPFADRAMNVNVFQLVKNFVTEIALKNVQPALTIDIKDFNFDKAFIQSNPNFLKENLLDADLADKLDAILEGINSSSSTSPDDIAQKNALLALKYLFEVDNIFNTTFIFKDPTSPPPGWESPTPPQSPLDPNDIKTSFNASSAMKFYPWISPPPEIDPNDPVPPIPYEKYEINLSLLQDLTQQQDLSHKYDGANNKDEIKDGYLLQIFLIFNFFYQVYNDKKASKHLNGDMALTLVNMLASKEIQSLWQAPHNKDAIANAMNTDACSEIMRRIPGFFTMINHMVKPFIPKLEQESFFKQPYKSPETSTTQSSTTNATNTENTYDPYLLDYYKNVQQRNITNTSSLNNLIEHLQCNKDYYIQQYLKYISTRTKNQSILDFASTVISSLKNTSTNNEIKKLLPLIFNIEDSYINIQQIIIPAYKNLTEGTISEILKVIDDNLTFSFSKIPTLLDEIQVPTDGIHLEVSESNCILKNLPSSTAS